MPKAAIPPGARALFGEQCTLCHTDDGTKGLAPNLIGVLGRRIATTDFPYSAAMRSKSWSWDEAILDTYLQSPQAMLPGIEMPFSIPDKSERRDIIAYIATLTSVANPAEIRVHIRLRRLAAGQAGPAPQNWPRRPSAALRDALGGLVRHAR